jgi:hypothetical protein
MGWTFLWAFLDKAFGLGFGTGRNSETGAILFGGPDAWVNGGGLIGERPRTVLQAYSATKAGQRLPRRIRRPSSQSASPKPARMVAR